MNAAALLSELRRRDIRVWAAGGELRCSAPPGALTPELRAQLRQHKREILAFVASAQALAGQQPAIVPLQPKGSRAPVFAVPGHNGDVFCYRVLAQALGEEQPFFGLQPPGLDGRGDPLKRVEDIAAYFVAQVRAFRPQGPYVIAGFCAGGTIAFELAQQLLAGGAAVSFVALFGSPYPSYFRRRTQWWQCLRDQAGRFVKLASELGALSRRDLRRYCDEKLARHRARRDAARAAALDPVLAPRVRVQRATVAAVRRYEPRRFAGRLCLFLAGRQWQRSSVAARRWLSVALQGEEYCGPDGSEGFDMLRERHAPQFAELFRRCRDSGETNPPAGCGDLGCGPLRVKEMLPY